MASKSLRTYIIGIAAFALALIGGTASAQFVATDSDQVAIELSQGGGLYSGPNFKAKYVEGPADGGKTGVYYWDGERFRVIRPNSSGVDAAAQVPFSGTVFDIAAIPGAVFVVGRVGFSGWNELYRSPNPMDTPLAAVTSPQTVMPDSLTPSGERLYFRNLNALNGTQELAVIGATGGANTLALFPTGSAITNLTAGANGSLYFIAKRQVSTNDVRTELWKTDGTLTGTRSLGRIDSDANAAVWGGNALQLNSGESFQIDEGPNNIDLSLQFWMRPDRINGTNQIFTIADSRRGLPFLNIAIVDGSLFAAYRGQATDGLALNSNLNIDFAAVPVQVGEWTHVGIIINGTNGGTFGTANVEGLLLINGTLTERISVDAAILRHTLSTTSGNADIGESFEGALDEIRIFDRPFLPSPQESLRTYTNGLRVNLTFEQFSFNVNTLPNIRLYNHDQPSIEITNASGILSRVDNSEMIFDPRTSTVYLTGYSPANGVELWRSVSDGAPSQYINLSGNASSNPSNLTLTPFSDQIVYSYGPQRRLAVFTNGSLSSTGSFSSIGFRDITVIDSTIYYIAGGGNQFDPSLWTLVPPGTLNLFDIAIGNEDTRNIEVGPDGDLFVVAQGPGGHSLHRVTGPGTTEFINVVPRDTGNSPDALVSVGNRLLVRRPAGPSDSHDYTFVMQDRNPHIRLDKVGSSVAGATFAVPTDATGDAQFGYRVTGVGDINGDGFEDIAISAPDADPDGLTNAGIVYIALGPITDGTTYAAGDYIRFKGFTAGDRVGVSLSGVGDVNGDGYSDFAVGAPDADRSGRADQGEAYIVFGSPSRFVKGASFGLNESSGSRGVVIRGFGQANARLGSSIAGAGNVNGDTANSTTNLSLDDILIGAEGMNSNRGEVFLVYGSRALPSTLSLTTLGNAGTRISFGSGNNPLPVNYGSSVAGVGDMNGDGLADFLLTGDGSLNSTFITNQYLVYGRQGGYGTTLNAASPPSGTTVVRISLDGEYDTQSLPSAQFASPAGDINGDGFADLVFRTHGTGGFFSGGSWNGGGYVVYGSSQPLGVNGLVSSMLDANNDGQRDASLLLGSINSFPDFSKEFATSLASAGDANGDGFGDFLVGSAHYRGNLFSNRYYLLYGNDSPEGVLRPIEQQDFSLVSSYRSSPEVTTSSYSNFLNQWPASVSAAGDVNGDGTTDIIVSSVGSTGLAGTPRIISSIHTATEGTYTNYIASGLDSQGIQNRRVPVSGPGSSADGRFVRPQSRLTFGFEGGGAGADSRFPSRQTVTLRRTAPPVPTGRDWRMTPVQWVVQTDRESQSIAPVQSTLTFYFTDDEIAGLNPDRVGVFKTLDDPPTANSQWIPVASVRDDERNAFVMTRLHQPARLGPDVNGTYSIIEVNEVYDLGDEIIPPQVVINAINSGNLTIFPPEVTPAESGFWHVGTRKLYATAPNSPVQILWRDNSQNVLATQIVNTRWPLESEFQLHVSGTPDVDVTNGGFFQSISLMATDPDNPAGVNKDKLENQRLFEANGPSGLRNGNGRSLLMLSTGSDARLSPIYFLPVRTISWNDPNYGQNKGAKVAYEIAEPALHNDAAGGPFIFHAMSYYNPSPGFYNRATRTGPIFPVNIDLDSSTDVDDMAVVYYQRTGKLKKALEQSLITNTGLFFPWTTVRYNVQWPAVYNDPVPANNDAGKIIIASLAGSGPLDPLGQNVSIYVQNNRALPGFNPNEEHAVVLSNIVYPLRNDLNIINSTNPSLQNTSHPYVLAQFDVNDAGKKGMYAFRVLMEEGSVTFTYEGTAGTLVQRPMPLPILTPGDDPCPNSSTNPNAPNGSRLISGSGYIDKNGNLWARNGSPTANFALDKAPGWSRDNVNNPPVPIQYQYFYANQPSFFYPSETPQEKPVGTCVPWLDRRPGGTVGVPVTITYNIRWPANVPEMRVGQTLVRATVGLPDIVNQISVRIVYDQGIPGVPTLTAGAPPANSSALLYDPLGERRVNLDSVPASIKTEQRGGNLVFVELEPSLKARLFYDTTRKQLVFRGFYVTEETPERYVLPNVLTTRERNYLTQTFSTNGSWVTAINAIPGAGQAGTGQIGLIGDPTAQTKALSTTGRSAGFMVIAFNDNIGSAPDQQAPPALPVSMSVIKITCPPYVGMLDAIEPDCVFDEKLTMRHTADIGGNTDDYVFEWAYQPDIDGTQPPLPLPGASLTDNNRDDDNGWIAVPTTLLRPNTGLGAVDFTIQGPGVLTLSDNWFIARYRKVGPGLCGTDVASGWTPPQLGEGWIKRVLGRIDPFRQRASGGGLQTAEDRFFQYNNTTINTMVSMIAQAGPRYGGDIALNCATLDNFGLIEIYQTVLNRGVSLSIRGIPPVKDYAPANNALLLATSRISDLYMLLGNEAYADALDPTIGIGSDDGRFGAVASSIHAFMNQTPSLIGEELALLRGRDDRLAPGTQVSPVYNKLFWNFTRDITGGEVAYALNYNIKDASGNVDGNISSADAARLYPQGHGDAWGHYLTALKSYMFLLREPNFSWIPRAEAVLVNGVPVSVDYLDERKFAGVAAAKARAGAEIVDLTYRAVFTENPEGQFTGYQDSNKNRAWGFAEWSSRAGQGAYLDYIVANAILPAQDNTGEGIQKIDRTTVPELAEIVAHLNSIQARVDTADEGLNPLGLAKNVVLFDIDPTQVVSTFGTAEPHFERVYNKAIEALNNAQVAFDYANSATQAIRSQADSIAEFQQTVEEQEADFAAQLVNVFGTPYPEDIGVGGTYPAGYTGPDYLHWMYTDPVQVPGLGTAPSTPITILVNDFVLTATGDISFQSDGFTPLKAERSVTYHFTADGSGIVKPPEWTSRRRIPGTLQLANQELDQARLALRKGLLEYSAHIAQIDDAAKQLGRRINLKSSRVSVLRGIAGGKAAFNTTLVALKAVELGAQLSADLAQNAGYAFAEGIPKSTIAGLAVGGDFLSGVRAAINTFSLASKGGLLATANIAQVAAVGAELGKEALEDGLQVDLEILDQDFEIEGQKAELEQLLREEPAKRIELYQLQLAVEQAAANVKTALSDGETLLEQRIRFRRNAAAAVQEYRYKDMAFRIFRNDALQKYRAQFDSAAQYAYLAATAYDYETNLLPGDSAVPGSIYMTQITRSRSLGTIIDGVPQPGGATGDPGLASFLARMQQNWQLNLKTRLGFNNPILDTRSFSLRSELFRIPEGEEYDEDWQAVLLQAQTDNILDDPDFRTYAIPFTPRNPQEPGFIFKFGTNISFAKNFFGWDLAAGDALYNSTASVIKLRRHAILLQGYNDNTAMTTTPLVYLFAAGSDIMRSPTGGRGDVRVWKIYEQLIPVPFPLSAGDLASEDYLIPRVNPLTGISDFGVRRRFRLVDAIDADAFEGFDPANPSQAGVASDLVGRSVWNSRWTLVIPAGSLLADRQEALRQFVYGADGEVGITDIKLGFESYGFAGTGARGATAPVEPDKIPIESPPSEFEFAPVLGRAHSNGEVK